jgi:hypothetical protein
MMRWSSWHANEAERRTRIAVRLNEDRNVVHARAVGTKICFNTTPGDTAEAVQRWV